QPLSLKRSSASLQARGRVMTAHRSTTSLAPSPTEARLEGRKTMMRSLRFVILALVLGVAAPGCVETVETPSDPEVTTESFAIQPTISVEVGNEIKTEVRLDRVFIGVASILFEPVDDPSLS